ncbi:uroporphyrinogen-III synthase [Rothia sp. P5766]|uniref:uroporphyrinogen-III synthase n=1 Tax=Rothia sp. P5766 TaxID=3402656 RepID=UPI003ADAFE31
MSTYLITRTPHQAAAFTRQVQAHDHAARVLCAPVLQAVARQPEDWEEIAFALVRGEFSWVTFTSANGVLGLEKLAQEIGQPLVQLLGAAQIAAVGRATEAALTERGLLVDFVPHTQSAAGMIEEWLIDEEWEDPTTEKVLAVQGTTASPVLEDGLTDYGYTVAPLAVYDMVPYPADLPLAEPEDTQDSQAQDDAVALTLEQAREALAEVDVLVATSPLLLKTLARSVGFALPPTVAIGASTRAAAEALAQPARPQKISVATSPAPAALATAAFSASQPAS